jgi:hypothetical protein
MAHATQHPAPKTRPITDVASWEPDRIRSGIRHMKFIRMIRLAAWQRHRRGCTRCQAWRADQQPVPMCPAGQLKIGRVRQAVEAIAILDRELEAALPPQRPLW